MAYVELQGWMGSTCTGTQYRGTWFFLSDDRDEVVAAVDVLAPGNCSCGYRGLTTLDGFGSGTIEFLPR